VAAATESLPRPEAKPPERKRRSFHRRYRKLILAGRILLGAAIVVGLLAICHFTYNAFNATDCYTDSSDNFAPKEPVQSDGCAAVLADTDNNMRLDASVALLGVAFVLSSFGCYRKARRYRPRAPIRPVRQH
jgi:hypothetical protein